MLEQNFTLNKFNSNSIFASDGANSINISLVNNLQGNESLQVVFIDKYYSINKIPPINNRRENRRSEFSTIFARLIDRTFRPLVKSASEVQIVINMLSFHSEASLINLISLALSKLLIANNIIDRTIAINLFTNEKVNLFIGQSYDKVIMVEMDGKRLTDKELTDAIDALAQIGTKQLEGSKRGQDREVTVNNLDAQFSVDKFDPSPDEETFYAIAYKYQNQLNANNFTRLDGRGQSQSREITYESNLIPKVNSSSFVTKGNTKVLSLVTLANFDPNIYEDFFEYTNNLSVSYVFNQFASGSIGNYQQVSRREIGHGRLIEKTVARVVNSDLQIRVVNEVFQSDGSTSQTSIIATLLALQNIGIEVEEIVSGVSIGMTLNRDFLVDINMFEDIYGFMDLKVASSKTGVFSLQLDVKNEGLSFEELKNAIKIARNANNETISKIKYDSLPKKIDAKQISMPRSDFARIIANKAKQLMEYKENKGIINLIPNAISNSLNIIYNEYASFEKLLKLIEKDYNIFYVGRTFKGKVTRIENYGYFVELFKGKDALLHLQKAKGEFKIGQTLDVIIIKIENGKLEVALN